MHDSCEECEITQLEAVPAGVSDALLSLCVYICQAVKVKHTMA